MSRRRDPWLGARTVDSVAGESRRQAAITSAFEFMGEAALRALDPNCVLGVIEHDPGRGWLAIEAPRSSTAPKPIRTAIAVADRELKARGLRRRDVIIVVAVDAFDGVSVMIVERGPAPPQAACGEPEPAITSPGGDA